jgi:hypothetical protein|tara:strand:+ start:779 stop:1651 length:873 start_codon:yes stop_codon:yes gene_type:complete
MGGGGGGGTQTTRSEPSEIQKPYLQDVYSQAQSQFQGGPMQVYPGDFYAAPSDAQLTGEELLKASSQGQAAAVANSLFPAFQSTLMSPSQAFADPMLQQSLAAGLQPVYKQTQGLLQQARRDSTGAGQLNSDRQALLEQGVIGDYLQKASDTAAKLYGDVYGDISKTRAASLAYTPQILSAFTTPAQTMMTAGALEQARAQQAIDEARSRFEFQQQAPAAALNQYANIVAGSILPGSTTVSGGRGGPSTLQSGLGGAMSGYALGGSGLGTALGMTGPMGAAIGLGLGLLS